MNLSVKKLITENDVRQAARGNRRVEVEKGTIITPLAKDLAREKGVKFVEKVYKLPAFLEDSQQEVWPVTTVAIGSDHGGFYMKEDLKNYIKELGYKVHDVGTMSPNACDYPDIALQVAELVKDGKAERGVIIDGVGIGSAMVANRVPGVLAAKCNGCFEARSSREHNYANVLTLGGRTIGPEIAREITATFLSTRGGAERHKKRVDKILEIEKKYK